ncbi:hypothetical protein ABKV19_017639, partial [Rosa sericea]
VHYVAKWKGITFMTSRQGLGVGGGTKLPCSTALFVNKGSGKFHLIPKQSEFSVILPNLVCIWESSSIFN